MFIILVNFDFRWGGGEGECVVGGGEGNGGGCEQNIIPACQVQIPIIYV